MWRFPQHVSNIEQMKFVLEELSKLDGINRSKELIQNILSGMMDDGIYSSIQDHVKKDSGADELDITTAGHKIGYPRFYQGVYQTSNKKLFLSSNGELLLKHWDNETYRTMIFTSMLFNIQYPNDYTRNCGETKLYPFRIIFNLLCDKDIEYLTSIEIAEILYYTDKMRNYEEYKKLKKDILRFRSLNYKNKFNIMQSNNIQFIKNFVNCNYALNTLVNFNILKKSNSIQEFSIKSEVRIKPTKINEIKFTLNKKLFIYVKELLEENSPFDEVIEATGLKDDWIRMRYNRVSPTMLKYIGESSDLYSKIYQLPDRLLDYSRDGERWEDFEKLIAQSFDLFDDLETEHIGGPGEPDVLCFNTIIKENFVCDGKATSSSLIEINDGRLKQHREKYNAKYTLVVTPKFRASTERDISNTETVLITSYCLSDLLSRYVLKQHIENKECSYKPIDRIIRNNLGKDVSKEIYNFIDYTLGISKEYFLG